MTKDLASFRLMKTPIPEYARRITELREARRWSQGELARKAGVTPQAIQTIEKGNVKNPQKLPQIAQALGVSVELLKSGQGEPPKTVPVVGIARAGGANIEYAEGQGVLGDVEAPAMSTRTTVALEVRGGSMGGRVEDGDLVFYEDRREPVTADLYGRLCVVCDAEGRVMIKTLKPGSAAGLFHLISYAADPEFDVKLVWAAKVTSIRPK